MATSDAGHSHDDLGRAALALRPVCIDLSETHGIATGPKCMLRASSEKLGWRSVLVTTQSEKPRQATYESVRHHLLTFHADGPTRVTMKNTLGCVKKVVAAETCTFVPSDEGFGVRIEDASETAHIYLHGDMVSRVIDEGSRSGHAPITLQPFFGLYEPLTVEIARACVSALNQAQDGCSLYADHLAWALAAHLVESNIFGKQAAFSNRSHGLTDRQWMRARDYILAHLDGDIGVEDLASAAGLSPVYFARKFKQRTGSSPYRFVRSVRIDRAKSLLLGDGLSIAQIALACGFCHQEHMTRVFKQECGTTPAAFRRTGGNQNENPNRPFRADK